MKEERGSVLFFWDFINFYFENTKKCHLEKGSILIPFSWMTFSYNKITWSLFYGFNNGTT